MNKRKQLAAHLAVCRPCAWEQAATDDFQREQAAMVLDPRQLDRLVDGALARAGVSVPRGRRQALGSRWGLAAVAMVAAAIVAAMILPARGSRDGARLDPPRASTEASLDAGAIGADVGGDS